MPSLKEVILGTDYFASLGKIVIRAILPFAKHDWL